MSLIIASSRPATHGHPSPLALFAAWRARLQTRRALAKLDARLLADIGMTDVAARRELEKPFWVA